MNVTAMFLHPALIVASQASTARSAADAACAISMEFHTHVSRRTRQIGLLQILAQHTIGAEARRQHRPAAADAGDPGRLRRLDQRLAG
ncbi:MAG: hypothetical protein ACP5NI_06190 [Acetobacteraceae bacterium]